MGSRDLSNLENNFNLKFVKYTDRNKPSCRKISLTLHYLQTSTVIYFHLFRPKNNSFTVFSSIYKKRRKKKEKHLAIIQSEKKNRREGGRGKKKGKYKYVGFRAVVEVLLAAGVDVNTRTSAGTAMHEAALCGKMEVVRALLDRGVDLGIRDSRQNTVLDLLGQFPPHVTQDITAVIKSAYPPPPPSPSLSPLSLSLSLSLSCSLALLLFLSLHARREQTSCAINETCISGGEKRRVSRRAVTGISA